jgi:MFS family permease
LQWSIILDELSPPSLNQQEIPPLKLENQKKAKIRILFSLCFLQTFYSAIFGLAFKNYLIFDRLIEPGMVGNISSAFPIAYIAGPFIGVIVTKKIGIKPALAFFSIFSVTMTGIVIFSVDPWVIIICRVLNGLSMGLFWPNVLLILSKWQKGTDKKESESHFRIFNYSWSFGLIFGFLAGLLIVLVWQNDFVALIISFGVSFLNIPLVLLLKNPGNLNGETDLKHSEYEQVRMSEDIILDKKKINTITPRNLAFPILFSWIGIFFVTSSKGFLNFAYPFFLNENIDYLVYIVTLIQQVGQIVGITYITSKDPHFKRYAFISSVSVIIIISLIVTIFNNSILIISIAISSIGLFLGIIHGTSQKIMLDYGAKTDSTKYTTINEILVGVGFGIIPLIAGYVIEWNLIAIFYIQMMLAIVTLITSIWLTRNVKK